MKILKLILDLIPKHKVIAGTGLSNTVLSYERKNSVYKKCGNFKPYQIERILNYRNRVCNELDYKLYELQGIDSEQNNSTINLILSCVEKDFVISELKDYLLKYSFIPQLALQTIAEVIKCNQNQSLSTFTTARNERKLVLIKHKKTGIVYFTYVVKHDGGFYYTLFEKDNVNIITMSYKDEFHIY